MQRHTILCVVLLIVGEHHQLGDIQETAKFLVGHALVHPVALGQNAVLVVGNLHLNKCQWQTVHKASDVGAEIVAAVLILASEFGGAMPIIVVRIVEVNNPQSTGRINDLVKLASQIVVVSNTHQGVKQQINIFLQSVRIQFFNLPFEHIRKDIGLTVIVVNRRKIRIAQSHKVQYGRYLYPRGF